MFASVSCFVFISLIVEAEYAYFIQRLRHNIDLEE